MFEDQFKQLKEWITKKSPDSVVTSTDMPNGGKLIKVTNLNIGLGWNRATTDMLFVAPPGYPSSTPDCFWVEPSQLRLAGGATPQASNDANPIPGDIDPNRSTTWFSWHVAGWNPNKDSLVGYFNLILDRLRPAR